MKSWLATANDKFPKIRSAVSAGKIMAIEWSSVEWCHMIWLRQKKFKSAWLEEKNKATLFMDQKGVVLVNFLLLYRNTKNSETLPALCSPNQKSAISAAFPCHCQVTHTCTPLKPSQRSGRQVSPLATYSPNLAPSDFHLFDPLKYTVADVTGHWRMLCVSMVVV